MQNQNDSITVACDPKEPERPTSTLSAETSSGPTPIQDPPTNGVPPDLVFYDGFLSFQKSGFPRELLAKVKPPARDSDDGDGNDNNAASCFRRCRNADTSPVFDKDGNPTPFVVPGTDEILEVAEFSTRDGKHKILVARGCAGSSWMGGKAAILVNFSEKNKGRTVWKVWVPGASKNDIKRYGTAVEKAIDGSIQANDVESALGTDYAIANVDSTSKRKRQESFDEDEYAPTKSARRLQSSYFQSNDPAMGMPQGDYDGTLLNQGNSQGSGMLPDIPYRSGTVLPSSTSSALSTPNSHIISVEGKAKLPVSNLTTTMSGNEFNSTPDHRIANLEQVEAKEIEADQSRRPSKGRSSTDPLSTQSEIKLVFKSKSGDWKSNVEPLNKYADLKALFVDALFYKTANEATRILRITTEGNEELGRFRHEDGRRFRNFMKRVCEMSSGQRGSGTLVVSALEYI